MTDQDGAYFKKENEKPPVTACLMHPAKKAKIIFEIPMKDPDFSGIAYGLCTECKNRKETYAWYKQRIVDEINKRLIKMKGNDGKVRRDSVPETPEQGSTESVPSELKRE